MVSFMCQYCDATLKKKQCQRHINNQCNPASLICITCGQIFRGHQYKKHTSCLSEQEKYWGQFAKPNKKNKHKNNQNRNENNISKYSQKFKDESIRQQKKDQWSEKQEQKIQDIVVQKKEKQEQQKEWKGWKNEIKNLIKENDNKMEKKQVIKRIRQRYHEKVDKKQQIQDSFVQQKINKIKKMVEITYVMIQ